MFTKKNIVMFFAGAAACHTISHAALYFSDLLPMTFCCFTLTAEINFWAVTLSAAATIGLLGWASQLKK